MQLEWIKDVIRSSTADFLLVGGHYPVYSAGMHGSTQCLIDKLKPSLDAYDVTAFLAGHDHNNQVWLMKAINFKASFSVCRLCAMKSIDLKVNKRPCVICILKIFFWFSNWFVNSKR